ncbi:MULTISPECIES: hypothetical protein [unclassified Streptomyces]|uniref:hypothetical protein n=1 Tax=unclassified Streptomyces TaxID=2593676 RepID=UPI003825D48F
MPVDIYAALSALVRAEATRALERRAAASAAAPAPGDAPEGPRTADAGAQQPREDSAVKDD